MTYKYIPSIPKPLLNDFVNNKVIPFIGAGFSKNADIPNGLSMPDWNELGKLAAEQIPGYTYDNNAIDALSYYEDLYSRTKLVELLMKELNFGSIRPGATYKSLCDLFTGTICTTNFDSLIEDTMVSLNRPVSIVVTEDRLTIENNMESKIIKLHGDFNHPDKMVITEHDYDVYLEKNPIFATYIANLFITKTMLLIGYSLEDNDFRGIWQIINSRLGCMAQPAYCITVGAPPEKIARYQRRNIRVINLDGKTKDYKTILQFFFIELKSYIDSENDKKARSTNERINEQMIIPADENKLCFISCATSRISQLSSLINPILHESGITPVRIDDMLMPGDNWIDISRTAIRKSKAAIIDISDSSPHVMLELSEIMSTKPTQNILVICEKGTILPVTFSNRSVLTYSFDVTNESESFNFTNKLQKWITCAFDMEYFVCNDNKNRINLSVAHRLFEQREYSACIVVAYSELEYQIYIRHKDTAHHTFTLNQYIKKNLGHNSKNASRLISLRNKIVHERYFATRKEALDFLNFVEEIVDVDINIKD